MALNLTTATRTAIFGMTGRRDLVRRTAADLPAIMDAVERELHVRYDPMPEVRMAMGSVGELMALERAHFKTLFTCDLGESYAAMVDKLIDFYARKEGFDTRAHLNVAGMVVSAFHARLFGSWLPRRGRMETFDAINRIVHLDLAVISAADSRHKMTIEGQRRATVESAVAASAQTIERIVAALKAAAVTCTRASSDLQSALRADERPIRAHDAIGRAHPRKRGGDARCHEYRVGQQPHDRCRVGSRPRIGRRRAGGDPPFERVAGRPHRRDGSDRGSDRHDRAHRDANQSPRPQRDDRGGPCRRGRSRLLRRRRRGQGAGARNRRRDRRDPSLDQGDRRAEAARRRPFAQHVHQYLRGGSRRRPHLRSRPSAGCGGTGQTRAFRHSAELGGDVASSVAAISQAISLIAAQTRTLLAASADLSASAQDLDGCMATFSEAVGAA